MIFNPSILQFGRSMRRALPRAADRTWVETRNKLEAFAHFQEGVKLASGGLCAQPRPDPVIRVHGFLEANRYVGLWMLEGVGYGLAERSSAADEVGDGTGSDALQRLAATDLADRIGIPLHAGFGLRLAEREVARLARTGERDIEAGVMAFAARTEEVAAEGYDGVVFEALGIACRLLQPDLVGAIDAALVTDCRRRRLFWHGVGRGLYFTPGNLLPWTPATGSWPALSQALDAPEASLRRCAVAGLSWALALVNIRHPVVVETRYRQAPEPSGSAFLDGATAGLKVWHRSHGVDSHLARFLRYENPSRSAAEAEAWRELFNRPLEARLASADPCRVDLMFQAAWPTEYREGILR